MILKKCLLVNNKIYLFFVFVLEATSIPGKNEDLREPVRNNNPLVLCFFSDFGVFLSIFLVLGILGFRVYRIFLGFRIFFRVSGILREGHFDAQKLFSQKFEIS